MSLDVPLPALAPTASLPAAGHAATRPTVPGYALLGELGRGSMGVVYQARHLGLNRLVALKMILVGAHADAELMTRFWVETQTVAKLRHPGIVQVYDSGCADGLPYCALELLPGGSLADRLDGQAQPPRDAAGLIRTLARTMHAAHAAGVVHRDLKPANVLFTADGEPKVADFGIAKDLDNPDGAYTRSGDILGTPSYMAPEQAAGRRDVGPAADVYALGVILYELLTGQLPFVGPDALDVLLQVRQLDPIPPRRRSRAIPLDLEVICLKCLEKAPAKRYASAAALADDLDRYLDGQAIQARPTSEYEKLVRWGRRNPVVSGLLFGVVGIFLVAFVLVATMYWQAEDARREESNQRQEAQRRVKAERWERYRANLSAASTAFQVANVGAARRALEAATREADGSEERRPWEWRHFWQEIDTAEQVLAWPDTIVIDGWLAPDGGTARLDAQGGGFRFLDLRRRAVVAADPSPDPGWGSVSPDGRTMAWRKPDGKVELRDVATGRVAAVLAGHAAPISDIFFSPTHPRLLTAARDGTVGVWETSGRRVWFGRPHTGHLDLLTGSPDGRLVATSQIDDPDLRVWEADTGREVAVLRGDLPRLTRGTFGPGGAHLLVVGAYPCHEMQLWEVATGRRVAVLRGHENQVHSFAFSPDGARLASGSLDQTIRLWDVATGACTAVLTGHRGWVNTVRFSPDGRRLVSASQDQSVRLWDGATGKPLAVLLGHTGDVYHAGYLGDGATIASVARDGTARLWDAAASERHGVLRGHGKFVYGVAFHPDGERVASASWDGTARLWEATTGRELAAFRHADDAIVTGVAFDPAGRLLASRGRDGSVRLWDVATGRLEQRWAVPGDTWRDSRVAFSPDGGLVAVGDADAAVRVWDVARGAEAAVLRGHRDFVRDVVFGPGRAWLASAGENADPTVRVWDLDRRAEARVLVGHRMTVNALALSPDGQVLASGSTDGTVRLWDVPTWSELAVLRHGSNVYGVAFLPDGSRLASACADNTIRLWDVASRQEVAELRGHGQYVHAVAFSPDGTRLVSGSGDATLRVWDTLPPSARRR